MFDMGAVKSHFSDAAHNYEAHAHVQRVVRRYAAELAKPLWPERCRILDVGCGTAAFARETKPRKWDMMQLDIAFGMCRLAQTQAPVVNSSGEALPFADQSFEGIFSSLMLQWCDTPHQVFAEMNRVLGNGHHVVLSTLVAGTLGELKHAFETLDSHPHISSFHETHNLLAWARQAGFSLVNAEQKPLIEHYPDTIALMRSLQAIGANNKHTTRRRGLMTPRQFAKLENTYQAIYHTPKGLPATWQVLFLVLRKD